MKTGQPDRNILLRFILTIGNFFKSLIIDPERRLVTISALMFVAAYPPIPLGFIGYFCLVPMLAVASGKGFKVGFKRGYLFGVIQGAILLYWVGVGIRSYAASADIHDNIFLDIFLWWVAPIGAPIALALIQALFTALLFGIYGWLSRGGAGYLLSFPLVWISVEYLRTLSEFAFPWVQLCYTQSMYLPMIQTAAWWGDLGVGFIIAIVNLLFYLAWKFRYRLSLALAFAGIAGLVLLTMFLYGSSVKYIPEGNKIGVALLQTNVSLKEKFADDGLQFALERNLQMAESLDPDSVALIIFPETSIREYLLHGSAWPYLASLARSKDACLLVGTFDRARIGKQWCLYNSAIQVDNAGGMEYVHHKMRLVPFSEKIPYNQYFPFINDFHFGQSDFCMGDSIAIFKTPFGDYAAMICFEVGFSDLNRQAVTQGAEFMVTITNDTWWGVSAGPYQHAYMVPFRAVENHRWYARCANSGFSFLCDPRGKIADLGPLFEQKVITGDVFASDELTFFTRHGIWLPKLILLFAFLLILNRLIGKLVKRVR